MISVTTPNSTVSNPEVDQIVNEIWSEEGGWRRRYLIETFVIKNTKFYIERPDVPHLYTVWGTDLDRYWINEVDPFFGDRVEKQMRRWYYDSSEDVIDLVVSQIKDRLRSVFSHLEESFPKQELESYVNDQLIGYWDTWVNHRISEWESEFLVESLMKVDVEKEVTNE
jgi:hypothetical protein